MTQTVKAWDEGWLAGLLTYGTPPSNPYRAPNGKIEPPTVREAIATVAAVVARAQIELAYELWDEYPEIGEGDWDDVCSVALALIKQPTESEYRVAYRLLEHRAEEWAAQAMGPVAAAREDQA